MNMQKINENKIHRYGVRGTSISIPVIFTKDNNLHIGDTVEVHRANIDGKDVLVIVPKKSKEIATV